MPKKLIKLAYRQVIDSLSGGEFERLIFNDTYMEFLMQAQAYTKGNSITQFRELRIHAPKSNSLHYKVGFAIGLYVRDLQNKIPGLTDTLEQTPIPFVSHRFEIIDSDTIKRELHRVAITYYTDSFTCFGEFGDRLLLAAGDCRISDKAVETFMLPLHPNLSVISYQE